jgi:uncharacterized protein YcnI
MKTCIAFLSVLALAMAAPAAAHVTADPHKLPADGFATIAFRVPHGCEGSPTTRVSVQIPEGVVNVKPEAVPGWTVATKTGKYAQPVDLFGEQVTEGVREVTWSGGSLPDSQYQDFGVSVKLPPGDAGTKLNFPTVQTCAKGVTRWIQIPVEGEDEPEEPTPQVELTAAAADEHAAAAETSAPAASEDEDEGDDGMAVAALGFGIAGFVAGLGALGLTIWRRPRRA